MYGVKKAVVLTVHCRVHNNRHWTPSYAT